MPLLPPGPRVAGVQALRYMNDTYGYLSECARRYGDPFTVPTLGGPLVYTADPEAVRQIFSADPDRFDVWTPEVLAPVVGDTSLLLVSGARHRRDRKLLMPPFHGARMRAYGRVMAEAASRVAARWRTGERVVALDAMQEISLEVILRAVFGVRDPARVECYRRVIAAINQTAHPAFLFFRFLRREFGGRGPWAKFLRDRARLDALIFEEIAQRRAPGTETEARDDVLSLMMAARHDDGSAMSDAELRDELLTLVLAGHETTAVTLAWALYWLHRDNDARARLLDEVDALGRDPEPDALAGLPFLDAVCNETLRLNPVVAEVVRLLREPFELRGYTLPAGAALAASISLVHEREEVFPDPRSFRPARFLGRKYSPFEFIPFGGGARRCLGAAFAGYEIRVVLATLLRDNVLRLASNTPVRPHRRGVTMGPEGGVPLVFDGRRYGVERAA
jgi:cytochrome P450